MSSRRLQEIVFLLPVFGLFLFLPPVMTIFQALSRASGFPVFLVYIFACWITLIAAAFILSRRLRALEEPPQYAGRERPPEG